MDEETLNQQIRKFLKKVGITSQREIEKSVRAALAAGTLRGDEVLDAVVTLQMNGIDLSVRIEDTIKLAAD